MKQYDSYKDSEAKWVGKIPSSWKRTRIKYLLSRSSAGVWGDDEKGDANDIVCFRVADFDYEHGCLSFDKLTYRNIDSKQLEGRTLSLGDLLIEKSGGGEATPVGRVVRYNYDDLATCSNFVHSVSVNNNSKSDYLYYYFFAMYANKENLLYFNQTTGIQNLKVGEYLSQTIYLPSLAEQQYIATYLDKKCAEIDKAIATQQKRIELLQELRQNTITHTVTRGINPDAPLKDSGVEWIGMVPEHWEVMMLKRCATIKTGCTPPTKEEKYYEADDIDWFTPGDIGDDCIEEAEKKISESARKEGVCRMFPPNSVYFVGIGATIGKVSYCDIEASANQQINAIIPNNRANYKYITYCLKSQKDEIFLTANTVTLPIINQERTGSLRIPVPPLKEQQAIVTHIESETAKLDKQVAKANRQIELLQELKQSIITELVTGKRKVC